MLLQALLIWAAVSAAPSLRVRDHAVLFPDSGAAAVSSDTSLHAVSRTPDFPRPVAILPPVRVDAEREAADLDRARRRAPTAFVTTLGSGRDRRALSSLAEALDEAAGVRVTQYGGLGAFSTMSLRGAPPGHVTVLLDGMPLTSAANGVIDLSGLPVTSIEAIEVYRGPSPVSFASPTPGGLVNLITQAGSGVRRLRAAAGSFGTGELQGTASVQRGALALLGAGGWQGSDGDFEYLDDNGTPLEPSDDRLARRGNTRFDAASGLLHGRYTPNDHVQLTARAEYFRRGQGVPGPGSVPVHSARFGSERGALAGDLRLARAATSPALQLRAHGTRTRSRLRDTAGELGIGRIDTDEHFADGGWAFEASSPRGWRALTLASGAALRGEHAEPGAPTAGLPDPPPSHRTTRAAWLSADIRALSDRVLLHAARRWDRQDEHVRDTRSTGVVRSRDTRRTLDAPQLGARLMVVRGLELRGNWSRAARAPEFDELFGIDGSITGNPLLVPEHSESWDAGASWSGRFGGLVASAEWSHHATSAHDLILFERSSPRGARAVNVGAARLVGEEAAVRAHWRMLELSANTAWLFAKDRSEIPFYRGRRLPQRSARQSSVHAVARRGAWLLAGDIEYLSDTYLDRANFNLAPARTLAGAAIARRFGRVRALFEGRNLGDRRTSDVAGFPLPGRMWLGSLTFDLGEGPLSH